MPEMLAFGFRLKSSGNWGHRKFAARPISSAVPVTAKCAAVRQPAGRGGSAAGCVVGVPPGTVTIVTIVPTTQGVVLAIIRYLYQEGNTMSRFYGTCLAAIVLLLAFIALRPIATPQPASAAERYQYRVVPTGIDGAQIQAELNARAADGWELRL